MGKINKLPSGTITFLFTDIGGSTELLEYLCDDYADFHAAALRAEASAEDVFIKGRKVLKLLDEEVLVN